jgi:tetratricopeptide (TPR) repeat protein
MADFNKPFKTAGIDMLESCGKDVFTDRVDIVLDELSLGIQWKRPTLILLIYRSEQIKGQIQSILEKNLEEKGISIVHYAIDKTHFDVPFDISNHPKHSQVVFIISGFRWGGGRGYSNAYRALNMHREYFIEENINALFWLTKYETKQLTRFSPDFWAFRHKVVEFLDLPTTKRSIKPRSSESRFHILYSNSSNDFNDLINIAERYYAMGCIDDAVFNFRKALHKYPEETAINLQIAEIYLSVGAQSAAVRILKKVNQRKIEKESFEREFARLNLVACSNHHIRGGFLERPD